MLTREEKEIARKINKAFKQGVCGFDLLRSKGKSYVCDVNGFSLVKSSNRYYIDCAHQIRKIILKKAKRSYDDLQELYDSEKSLTNDEENSGRYRPEKMSKKNLKWELRSVVGLLRHGDRTPKQKMKIKTKDVIFLKWFDG